MFRVLWSRVDNAIRFAIMCEECSVRALDRCLEMGASIWRRPYDGPNPCEVCVMHSTSPPESCR